MKTILIEKPRQRDVEIELYKQTSDNVQEIGAFVLIMIVLLIACMFVNPLIVFATAALLAVLVSVIRTFNRLKNMEYDFGNDLLDYTSLKEFREEYER